MVRRLCVLVAVAGAVLVLTAQAAGASTPASYRLRFAATFHVHVPRDAMRNGWCYDTAVVNSRTHKFFLADSANRRITTIDPARLANRGIGTGRFTGIANCHQNDFDGEGPNGLAIVGGRIYAGNGDSHVLGFSLRTGRLVANYDTGGKLQADEMTVAGHYLVVTNPAETPHPFVSIIDLHATKHPVVGRYVFRHATGLGQPRWWRGHLYISLPSTAKSPNGGQIDEVSLAHVRSPRLIRRFVLASCQPAGLAVDRAGLAAVGCGGQHQLVLNLKTGEKTVVHGVGGVDQVATHAGDFFYVSYITNQLVVADRAGHVRQTFSVGSSHTVTVDQRRGTVWVPEDKGNVAVFTAAR